MLHYEMHWHISEYNSASNWACVASSVRICIEYVSGLSVFLESESERALLPGMFAYTRNLLWWQRLPQHKQNDSDKMRHR